MAAAIQRTLRSCSEQAEEVYDDRGPTHNNQSSVLQDQSQGFHADRAAGGHCHHRAADVDPDAGAAAGAQAGPGAWPASRTSSSGARSGSCTPTTTTACSRSAPPPAAAGSTCSSTYYYKDNKFRLCPQATKIAAPQGATDTLTLGGDAFTAWGIVAAERRPAGRDLGQLRHQRLGLINAEPGGVLYGKPAQFFWKTPERQRGRAGPAVPGLLVLVRLAGRHGHAAEGRRPRRPAIPATTTP